VFDVFIFAKLMRFLCLLREAGAESNLAMSAG
jgi:hypothetical protein